MLIPKVKAKEFENSDLRNVRVNMERTVVIIFAFQGDAKCFCEQCDFDVNDWINNDPRIHKDANCRYRDHRTYLDIIYELIKADMLESR